MPLKGIHFQGQSGTNRTVPHFSPSKQRRTEMLYYALVFFVIALIAGVLGFGGIAGASAGIAQILFYLFLAFLVVSLIVGLFRRSIN
jgi:uncharacterized membrane protein YtjA (UPF0391 family)